MGSNSDVQPSHSLGSGELPGLRPTEASLKLNSGPGRKCVPVRAGDTHGPKEHGNFPDFLVCMENQPRQPWPTETCQMLEYPDWLSRPPKLYG